MKSNYKILKVKQEKWSAEKKHPDFPSFYL